MSGPGGFDFVIEFSREGLIEIISRNLRLGGNDLRPPTEIVQDIPPAAGGGTVSFALVGIDVALRGGPTNGLDIILLIERISVLGHRGFADISGLWGTMTISTAVDLVSHPMDRSRRLLVLLSPEPLLPPSYAVLPASGYF
jgi:hypothetical protein